MSDRYFAVSIDGTDWSKHIPRVGLSRSRTTLWPFALQSGHCSPPSRFSGNGGAYSFRGG